MLKEKLKQSTIKYLGDGEISGYLWNFLKEESANISNSELLNLDDDYMYYNLVELDEHKLKIHLCYEKDDIKKDIIYTITEKDKTFHISDVAYETFEISYKDEIKIIFGASLDTYWKDNGIDDNECQYDDLQSYIFQNVVGLEKSILEKEMEHNIKIENYEHCAILQEKINKLK